MVKHTLMHHGSVGTEVVCGASCLSWCMTEEKKTTDKEELQKEIGCLMLPKCSKNGFEESSSFDKQFCLIAEHWTEMNLSGQR